MSGVCLEVPSKKVPFAVAQGLRSPRLADVGPPEGRAVGVCNYEEAIVAAGDAHLDSGPWSCGAGHAEDKATCPAGRRVPVLAGLRPGKAAEGERVLGVMIFFERERETRQRLVWATRHARDSCRVPSCRLLRGHSAQPIGKERCRACRSLPGAAGSPHGAALRLPVP